ncbi:MAG: bifunctional DNA-formamidopyrimidine glycosylase/DNA-(apurinic or apyrimidinic site) lyase [Parcubacteria group bacterium]
MPELPEVENLRLGLERNIVGQKILKVKVNKPKLVSGKGTLRTASSKKVKEFESGLQGETFSSVERRAKNLIFNFKSGKVLLVHLKMSGQFVYKSKDSSKNKNITGGHPIQLSEKELPNKHTHVVFELNKGTLYYNDTRMFGYLIYHPSKEAFDKADHFTLLGLEPFQKEFTLEYFQKFLKNNKAKIKPVLMNQKVVTGLGNIYADESLFESKIKPERLASSLRPKEVENLHRAILRIMKRAVELGGSSVATYMLLDETRGNYAREHKVYGKSGKDCPICKKSLKTILMQSRTTVFCVHCQK